MPTIQEVLTAADYSLRGQSHSPLLDAEVLLCKIIGKNRAYLRAWPAQELLAEQHEAYLNLIAERQRGVPIAYLTGVREFWSRDFIVSPAVLIPRPETELLVELSLSLIPPDKPVRILDLGTGSGILAVTLAAERPSAAVTAADISADALAVARRNAATHQTSSVQFYQSDWFAGIPEGKFNLIVSNPPYISEDDPHLMQGDLRFEPQTALTAQKAGLADIRVIAESALDWLENNGWLMIEHGSEQGENVRTLFSALGYKQVKSYHDLANLPRVTVGQFWG